MNRKKIKKALAGCALATAFSLASGAAISQGGPGGMYGGGYDAQMYQEFREAAQQIPTGSTHLTLASNSTEKVGAAILCLFDVSSSIDQEEYKVQLEAMAAAIESREFRDAIFSRYGPKSIAIMVADFGSSVRPRIMWLDIREGQEYKLQALADEIRQLKRSEFGSTYQVKALNMSASYLQMLPWKADRTVIDIITDGQENEYNYDGEARLKVIRERLAKEFEATVNALVTIDSYPDIEQWAWRNLATQPGHIKADGTQLDPGFVKVVATQKSAESYGGIVEYRDAMKLAFKRKLILEVAGMELEQLQELLKAEENTPAEDQDKDNATNIIAPIRKPDIEP